MAVIRNITGDTRSLFHADAPPIHGAGCEDCGYPCNEVTVRDERFVERAWPTSTWELIEAPEGYEDRSNDDAYLFADPDGGSVLAEPLGTVGLSDASLSAGLVEARLQSVEVKGESALPPHLRDQGRDDMPRVDDRGRREPATVTTKTRTSRTKKQED